MSLIELKIFLYFQSICLFFAAIGISIREYLVFEARESFHWSYLVIFACLLLGFLLQIFAKNKFPKLLMSLGVYYAVISVFLTILLFIRL